MDDRRSRFERQVLPHLDAAYRFARWLARSPDDAQDIVQDAVLRAYRGYDALRGTDAKSWLLTIVRNCHSTSLKQQQRRAAAPLPDDRDAQEELTAMASVPDPETASIHRDERRALQRLMANLPDDYREVLVLREVEDMNYRDIAAVTNVPIGTVMSRLARARAALKKHWLRDIEENSRAVP
jgi:RNA polymerase sigma-70 factor (ECF subfamily)